MDSGGSQTRIWLRHKTRTELVFEVLSYDPVTHQGVVRGKLGAYDTPLWPDVVKRAGYVMFKENTHAK